AQPGLPQPRGPQCRTATTERGPGARHERSYQQTTIVNGFPALFLQVPLCLSVALVVQQFSVLAHAQHRAQNGEAISHAGDQPGGVPESVKTNCPQASHSKDPR